MAKDVHQVLRDKENELETVRKQVEALKIVAPLLSDSGNGSNDLQAVLADADARKRWP
jgi:hypothetical protein